MPRVASWDFPVKCVSAAVLTTVIAVIAIETDLLPASLRSTLRVRLHSAVDEVSRMPMVARIISGFH